MSSSLGTLNRVILFTNFGAMVVNFSLFEMLCFRSKVVEDRVKGNEYTVGTFRRGRSGSLILW